ncbi:MAG: ParA family protein [Deltaproteobacteria bacterium]|nr:ParA family protein [Deltaproteobacteria bacterium]
MKTRRAKVLAVANQKGGVGKTTTSLTLGSCFGFMGRKVLVIDLDPHACATIHMAQYPEGVERTAHDLFALTVDERTWRKAIVSEPELPFDFVPSHIRVSDLESDLKDRPGKGLVLKKALEAILEDYDVIILDCPPQVGVLQVNSLVAADLVIIPIQTDFLALHGLKLILDTIRMLNKILDRPIEYRALATMYDQRAGACRRVLELLRAKLGPRVFETIIHTDTKFREASAKGKVLLEYAPRSRGAQEYTQLAKEIDEMGFWA